MFTFIYKFFEYFISNNVDGVTNVNYYLSSNDNSDKIVNPLISIEIKEMEPEQFGNNYQQWIADIDLHLYIDIYNDLRLNADILDKSLEYTTLMDNVYYELNGLCSYDLPFEMQSDDYQINDIVRGQIIFPNTPGNVKEAIINFRIVFEDYSQIPIQETITLSAMTATYFFGDTQITEPLAFKPITQTSSSAYTWYNVLVEATGGTAPYTGTGTFVRQVGTHTFNITDASGTTITTSYTVEAPIIDSGFKYYPVRLSDGTYGFKSGGGIYLIESGAGRSVYINWGDGKDELLTTGIYNTFKYHTFPSQQIYNIEIQTLVSGGTIPVAPLTGPYMRDGELDIEKWFSTHIRPMSISIFTSVRLNGNVSAFYKSETTVSTLNTYMYTPNGSWMWGNVSNLQHYALNSFGQDVPLKLTGDCATLINQTYDGNIYVNFHVASGYICSAIDTGYTSSKRIQYFRVHYMQNVYLGGGYGVYAENVLLQVAQNQQYSGGTLRIETSDNLNYTKPDVLAAYNKLKTTMGWTLTLPNLPA